MIMPHQLLAWTGGSVAKGVLSECTGVFSDSRSPMVGGLFVALCGEKFDGHDFVQATAQAGAHGALVSNDHVSAVADQLATFAGPFFLLAVDNTLRALHGLARGYRRQFHIPVVAITGSNGKTTTKEMTAACLGTHKQVLATHRNYNNEIGLPLTLLGLEPEYGVCVVEMAMRAPGQIAQLASVALPDIAVVTNVGPVHLATLGTVANVAKAKAELVQALPAVGTAVLNADDPHVVAMCHQTAARVLTYGVTQPADVQARNVDLSASSSSFTLDIAGCQIGEVRVAMPGTHNVANALAALAVTYACGYDVAKAADALARLTPPPMRLEVSHLPGNVMLINDAYNASPLSMRAALEVLAVQKATRRVAVLGDMLELGVETETQHRLVGRYAVETEVDTLITVGEGGKMIAAGAQEAGIGAERCIWYPTVAAAIGDVHAWIRPGDCILVKASRGMRLEQVAEKVAAIAQACRLAPLEG